MDVPSRVHSLLYFVIFVVSALLVLVGVWLEQEAEFYEASVLVLTIPVRNNSESASTLQRTLYEVPPGAENIVRINCGGGDYVDQNGNEWQADKYSEGWSYTRSAIPFIPFSNTEDDALYSSHRVKFYLGLFPDMQGSLKYSIPVKSEKSKYYVRLLFAESYVLFPGWRLFDVYVEGTLVADALDVRGSAGMFGAYDVETEITVTDGMIDIDLKTVRGAPMISGIAIYKVGKAESTPTSKPIQPPVTKPAPAPVPPPVSPPVPAPVPAPVSQPVPPPTTVTPDQVLEPPFRINTGGSHHIDIDGREWLNDAYFQGGQTYYAGDETAISSTQYDFIYRSHRYGDFKYNIPVPSEPADYEIILHFCEVYFNNQGKRNFSIDIEGEERFGSVDVMVLSSNTKNKAVTLEIPVTVSDGLLNIELKSINNYAMISGIEVKNVVPHLAHAVPGGPYEAVDLDGDGFATIYASAVSSHTHGTGLSLVSWVWKLGAAVVAEGEEVSIKLPVGENTISLTVTDSGGNKSTESTRAKILPSSFPVIDSINPSTGIVRGGDVVRISGSNFAAASSSTYVKFGLTEVEGSALKIIDSNTIELTTPGSTVASSVAVSVVTPSGESNKITFTYIAANVEIKFDQGKLNSWSWIEKPTVAEFGPDGKLYIGTEPGKIYKLTLDDNFNVINEVVTQVTNWRPILGLAFDPLDTSNNPAVYFSHSKFFHGGSTSSSGMSINGAVSVCRGSNMDEVDDLITGLPVSDHDHGVNDIEFGDNGELYINVGGNTNAGIPGQLTGAQLQKESPLSAATLVAYVSNPNFNGNIEYDAWDDGNVIAGDVEVFAAGQRNPFGLILHSNGRLYSTDNGPNLNYGDVSTGCNSQIPDIYEIDKLNIVDKGNYYGHPNRKRGETDPRQCSWRSQNDPATNGYTPPILKFESSTDGITEFATDHFGGQLRGNLIVSKYKGDLSRVILNKDGTGVIPESNPALWLASGYGLDVTQGPDGTLIETRFASSEIVYHKPKESPVPYLIIKGVFPRRGGYAGGSKLTIYGENFDKSTPSVSVGGSNCPVQSVSSKKITCTLPGGTGTVDITVSSGSEISVFKAGYRFIKGTP